MSEHDRPPTVDPVASARWLSQAVPVVPWLHDEVGRRMVDRLGWIRRRPERWLDWSPALGGSASHDLICALYPDATAVFDGPFEAPVAAHRERRVPGWRRAMHRWTGRVHGAAHDKEPVDMLWSNMGLHMTDDPGGWMRRWHDALSPDGFLMFSCLGPDTLKSIRQAWQAMGWGPAGHDFTDMHDWGDQLVHAGFAEPVMDMERITLTYNSLDAVIRDVSELGRNLHPARFGALRGQRWYAAMRDTVDRATRKVQGEGANAWYLECEIVYGHAFMGAPRRERPADTAVSLDEMRNLLRSSKNK
jgi:malonyl-CoA O-methyltransferase